MTEAGVKSNLRIGIVTVWFDRGAGMVSKAYRQAFQAGGHEVFIYARGGEIHPTSDPAWAGPDVTWQPQRKGWDSTAISIGKMSAWVVENSIDVVLFNEQHFWPSVVAIRRRFPDLVLGSYVDYYTADTVKQFAMFDFLFCNTRRHHKVFSWHPSAFYIPWGTDVDTFAPRDSERSNSTLTFLHSAGMNLERKGTRILVEAFLMLEAEAKLILHVQQPINEASEFWEWVESCPRIKLINQTIGPPGLYHLGDVYVYPTNLEGIGLTICEALACGLPVITTDCAPMNEFVTHGVDGFLCSPDEFRGRSDGYYWAEAHYGPEKVLDGMNYFLERQSHIDEFSNQARKNAVDHRDWKRNARHVCDLVVDALEQPRTRINGRAIEQTCQTARLPLSRGALRLAAALIPGSAKQRFLLGVCN